MADTEAQEEGSPPPQEPPTPIPGLLGCRKLTVNKGQITVVEEKLIERTIADQENILQKGIHSTKFMNAARNVTGLMYYHSYEKSLAIGMWKKTLKVDPRNLNALQDLATAYGKLRNSKEANHYKELLQKALEEDDPDEKKLMNARCQVEQAYALFWDLHTESWSGIGLREEQVQTYEAALQIAGDLMDCADLQKEKRDWLLFTGQAHERLCHAYFRDGQQKSEVDSFDKATQYLKQSLKLSHESDAFSAEVWYILANAFPNSSNPKFQDEFGNSLKYYLKALEHDPQNIWVLGRIGVTYFKNNKLAKSLEYLTRAIEAANNLEADNPLRKSCWNALCHRAKVYIKKVKTEFNTNPKKAQRCLIDAKHDSLQAVDYNINPVVLTVAGEVHTLLASNLLTEEAEKEHLRDVALEKFYEASILQDGSSISNTHFKWARCLKDKGDLPSAIESYKIAFDTASDTSGKFLALLALELLRAMLQNFAALHCPDDLAKEVAFWFVYINARCSKCPVSYAKLPWQYAPEILDVLKYMVKHVPDLSSKVLDISSGLLKRILEEMEKWCSNPKFKNVLQDEKYDQFEKNLKDINDLNEFNIKSPPQRSAAESPEDNPCDEERSRQPLHHGVSYDFCVIYDTNNPDIEGWVKNSLLTGLEIDFFGLKGYYQKRSKLGALPLRNWEEVMKRSAKVLVVLSHGFNGNEDILTEMAQIVEKNEIIVIQREHVAVPIKLQVYHKLNFTVQPNIPELARHLMPVRSLQTSFHM